MDDRAASLSGRSSTYRSPAALNCLFPFVDGTRKLRARALSTAAAVFGVYFKLQSFAFMPVFGLNNGMVPIISYNYGARRPDRVKETIRLAAFTAEAIMLLGFAVFQLFPGAVLSLFNASDQMLAIGEVALRTISVGFLMAGVCVVLGSVFQALGKGMLSLYVSFGRQIVVLLPAAWLLSRLGRLELVWWAFPIAELASLALSLGFLWYVNRTILRPLAQPADSIAPPMPEP